MKRGVLIISLLILFSRSVYASEIPWPDNVEGGEGFHENLYTDVIDDASGDNLIEIRANLNFYWVQNLTNVTIENTKLIGDTTHNGNVYVDGDINTTTDLFIGGNFDIGNNLYVAGTRGSEKIWSSYYCMEDGVNCYSTDNITEVYAGCEGCVYPTLYEILSNNGTYEGVLGNASNFNGTTIFGGKIEAPNFAAKLSGGGEVNYYLENTGGLSRIMQDSDGFMYIQSESNKIKIEGWNGGSINKIEFNADTTKASVDLVIDGNTAIGIDSSDGYMLYVNGSTKFMDDIIGTEGFSVYIDRTDVYDDATSNSPYSRVNADSFHTNSIGEGQIYIEGRAIDADAEIAIGNGLASVMNAVDVVIGKNNEIFVDTSANSVGIGFTDPLAKLSIDGGVHVGGTTDPGDNDLLVDGDITVGGTVDGKDIADNAAMINEAETISANWVNTANPWADDEVAADLTISSSGTVDKGALENSGSLGFDWTNGEVANDLTISSSGSVNSTALIDGGTISFYWANGEIADDLTINSSGSVDKGAIARVTAGTLGFDWVDAEVAADLNISSSGSVNSTALIDGGTISFKWVDAEVSNTLTASEITCDGCIAEGEIAQNSLDDSEIENNSLTAGSLATNSVDNLELEDNIAITDLTVTTILASSGNPMIIEVGS